jgi:RNA polymerase sigma-70 factor (ECF subfamily)
VYLTADSGRAEELTQETFASAWAEIASYKGRSSLGTWLHRIAYHKFIDSGRRLRRAAALTAKLKGETVDAVETFNPLQRLMADEHSRLLYEAIQRLEPLEHIVIILHYIQGLTFRQVAKVMDEPVGTIKWRTSRALKKLKAYLTDRV